MQDWLKKQNKYTSHEIQNELLKIVAHRVLRDVADHLQKSDTESKARIQGVQIQMKTFDFLFGDTLGELDNLSKILQDKSFSAAEGQQV